jgi:hypothetical protein
MHFKSAAVWLILTASLLSTPVLAWEEIGYQQADMVLDRDIVKVRGADWHKSIRLCVEQRPLRLRDLDVKFANGGKQDVQVRQLIGAGSCTRAINLRGNRRNIREIVMLYDKLVPGKPAIVKVYAQ